MSEVNEVNVGGEVSADSAAIVDSADGGIEAARREWEKGMKAKLEAARREGERVASLSAEERFRESQADLDRRERDVSRRELRVLAGDALEERGLPRELIGAVCLDSLEDMDASILSAEKAFRAAVSMAVRPKMGAQAPSRALDITNVDALTDEQYFQTVMPERIDKFFM